MTQEETKEAIRTEALRLREDGFSPIKRERKWGGRFRKKPRPPPKQISQANGNPRGGNSHKPVGYYGTHSMSLRLNKQKDNSTTELTFSAQSGG